MVSGREHGEGRDGGWTRRHLPSQDSAKEEEDVDETSGGSPSWAWRASVRTGCDASDGGCAQRGSKVRRKDGIAPDPRSDPKSDLRAEGGGFEPRGPHATAAVRVAHRQAEAVGCTWSEPSHSDDGWEG